jgi:hypothetical protein
MDELDIKERGWISISFDLGVPWEKELFDMLIAIKGKKRSGEIKSIVADEYGIEHDHICVIRSQRLDRGINRYKSSRQEPTISQKQSDPQRIPDSSVGDDAGNVSIVCSPDGHGEEWDTVDDGGGVIPTMNMDPIEHDHICVIRSQRLDRGINSYKSSRQEPTISQRQSDPQRIPDSSVGDDAGNVSIAFSRDGHGEEWDTVDDGGGVIRTMNMDPIDIISGAVFKGYVVRKDLPYKCKEQYPVPMSVVEDLILKHGISADPEED